jgi:hypothetical protein
MKTVSERLKKLLKRDRHMTTISIRMPEDLIDDLKEIAPTLGFSGYQPLIRAYIGQGLRRDLANADNSHLQALTQSLRKQGIADQVISAALTEAKRTARPNASEANAPGQDSRRSSRAIRSRKDE